VIREIPLQATHVHIRETFSAFPQQSQHIVYNFKRNKEETPLLVLLDSSYLKA